MTYSIYKSINPSRRLNDYGFIRSSTFLIKSSIIGINISSYHFVSSQIKAVQTESLICNNCSDLPNIDIFNRKSDYLMKIELVSRQSLGNKSPKANKFPILELNQLLLQCIDLQTILVTDCLYVKNFFQ